MPIKESLYNDDLEYEIVETGSHNTVTTNSSSKNEINGYKGLGSSLPNTVDAIARNSARAVESITATVGSSIVSYNQRMTSEHSDKRDVAMAAMGNNNELNAVIADRLFNGKEEEKTKRVIAKTNAQIQKSADRRDVQIQKSADRRDVQIRRSDNSLEKIRLKQEGKTARTSCVTNTISSFCDEIDFNELNGIKKK